MVLCGRQRVHQNGRHVQEHRRVHADGRKDAAGAGVLRELLCGHAEAAGEAPQGAGKSVFTNDLTAYLDIS